MHPVVSPTAGQLYGLEKFWAFLKYSKIKNQPIDPKLQEHLSQFKNLEDFRVVVSVALHVCTCARVRERAFQVQYQQDTLTLQLKKVR